MAERNSDILLVSALNDDQSSFSLWNLRTGNLIKSYKASQQQGCLCLARAGRDYVLASQEKKQVISVWEWRKVSWPIYYVLFLNYELKMLMNGKNSVYHILN